MKAESIREAPFKMSFFKVLIPPRLLLPLSSFEISRLTLIKSIPCDLRWSPFRSSVALRCASYIFRELDTYPSYCVRKPPREKTFWLYLESKFLLTVSMFCTSSLTARRALSSCFISFGSCSSPEIVKFSFSLSLRRCVLSLLSCLIC